MPTISDLTRYDERDPEGLTYDRGHEFVLRDRPCTCEIKHKARTGSATSCVAALVAVEDLDPDCELHFPWVIEDERERLHALRWWTAGYQAGWDTAEQTHAEFTPSESETRALLALVSWALDEAHDSPAPGWLQDRLGIEGAAARLAAAGERLRLLVDDEPEVDLVVAAGHGEYGVLVPGLVDEVWNPNEDALSGAIFAEQDRGGDVYEFAARLYRERTGLEPLPDEDLTWNLVYRIQGSRAAALAWLDALILDIGDGPEGGDDETFDYWPSGVRLALSVADALEPDLAEAVRARLREGLAARGLEPDEVNLAGWLDEEGGGEDA